jgi:hypothetical protein
VVAPILATAAFQELGHASPFLLGAAVVALVGLLAFRVAVPTPLSAEETG